MVKNLLLYSQKNQWIIIALIISIILHFSLILNISLDVPAPKQNKQSLNIKITHTKTNSTSAAKNHQTTETNQISDRHTTTVNKVQSNEVIPPLEHQPSELKQAASKVPSPSVDEVSVTQNGDIVSNRQDESLMEATPEPLKNTNSIINNTNKPSPPTYQYVELEFSIFNGQPRPIGRSIVTFTLDENGTYILAETAQFQDPITSRTHTIKQKSNGVITENGLIPGYYSYEDTGNLKSSISASFAWVESFVNVQHLNQTNKLPLREGTQDALSIKYQLMFNPYDIPTPVLANTELVQRQFKLVAEETIPTNMGSLKCLHLQTEENKEKLELWLALDYQFMPVKLLRVDDAGVIIEEKVVNSIGVINRQ